VGVLEGTIRLAHDMIHDGILTETEALHQIEQLLKDSDFRKGAKKLEVNLTESVADMVISIQNLQELNNRKVHEEYKTPIWWSGSVETFWQLILGAFFGSVLGIYWILIFLGLWKLQILATLFIGSASSFIIAYYVRRVRYPSVFRSTFFVSMVIYVSGGMVLVSMFFFSNVISRFLLQLLPVIIFSVAISSFSGEWLGKRHRY
jgi:hypothetical protein